jgi:hypothetical protein
MMALVKSTESSKSWSLPFAVACVGAGIAGRGRHRAVVTPRSNEK